MKQFNANDLCTALAEVATLQGTYETASGTMNKEQATKRLYQAIHALHGACQKAGMTHTSAGVLRTVNHLHDAALDISALAVEARHVRELVISGLESKYFFAVQMIRAPFVDNYELLGADVSRSFKLAKDDIKDAGTCLVIECSTAAVFHFMRVAEYGLRALARKMKVKLTDKRKPQPIEYGTWEKIIVQLNNRIEEAHQLAQTAIREKKLEFYADMAEQCGYLKDLWRNPVSHARRSYNPGEAMGVKQRVGDFMQKLTRGLR